MARALNRPRTVRHLLWLLLAIAGLAAAPRRVAAGTTYYVDATQGRDTYSGTVASVDDTLREGPWQTLSRIRSQPLAPGDSILLKRGEVWRDSLVLPASGAAGRPITIGSYATGALPVISGADVISGWSPVGSPGHTYAAWVMNEPGVVYFGPTRGTRRDSPAALSAANDWCWVANTLYVQAPDDRGLTVEAGARGAAILILGQSYITIQDVLLERSNGSGLYVETSTAATSHLVVQRVTSRDSRYAGMTFKNGHPTLKTTDVLVLGNTVYGNGASGINVSEGVNSITIANNIAHHNNWSGDLYQAGIRIWAKRQDARNLVVERNESYSNYFVGTGWQNGHGIWLDEVADGAVVRYNYSHDNGNVGLFVEHSDRAKIYYNLVTNNRDASILLYRGVHGHEVYNNTIYGGGTGIRLAGDGAADSVVGNIVKNNISVGLMGQRVMAGDGGENDGVKGSANVYLHNALGRERPGLVVWGYGVIKSSYREWDAAYDATTQSVEGEPRFVGGSDFRLRQGSPGLRAGVDVGLASDIRGVAVPAGTAPDVGAYQSPAGGTEAPASNPW